jgi:fluoroquinolone transport system permease protein
MSRLIATSLCDVRIQLRNGFYYASALVVVSMIVLLNWLPDEWVAWLLPVIIIENMLVNMFYFVGGLILLEKGERTLEAQTVTPLRLGEYLAAKLTTLGALCVVESLLIVIIALGVSPGLVPLTIGIVLTSVLLCLAGVIVAVRYDSINEYLMPSVVYTAIFTLPLLGYFGIGPQWIYFLHPMQGPIELMRAMSEPVAWWRIIYAIVYPTLWVIPMYLWSRHALRRFVS